MEYIGKKIKILYMKDEPGYSGRIGTVERVDDLGQLHGSWGGLAVVPEVDLFEILENNEN